jgi:hypothetical protein
MWIMPSDDFDASNPPQIACVEELLDDRNIAVQKLKVRVGNVIEFDLDNDDESTSNVDEKPIGLHVVDPARKRARSILEPRTSDEVRVSSERFLNESFVAKTGSLSAPWLSRTNKSRNAK